MAGGGMGRRAEKLRPLPALNESDNPMCQPTRQLQIPAEINSQAEEIVSKNHCSTESALLDGLAALFSTELEPSDKLDALNNFSDEQLWIIVQRRLTPKQDARWRELTDFGNRGTLTTEQNAELQAWVARLDGQMLLRSRALRLLQERGHDIQRYFGLTATGRATIQRLKMNRPAVVGARKEWLEAGWHPPNQ